MGSTSSLKSINRVMLVGAAEGAAVGGELLGGNSFEEPLNVIAIAMAIVYRD